MNRYEANLGCIYHISWVNLAEYSLQLLLMTLIPMGSLKQLMLLLKVDFIINIGYIYIFIDQCILLCV